MARSLKTNYLLVALAVAAVLALLLGGLAYYEHRVNTADANQLTYATVERSLEADLEARASSLSKLTVGSLAPALLSGNKTAIVAIAQKLLDERDIARIEILDVHGNVLYGNGNPAARETPDGPFVLQSDIRGNLASPASPRLGSLQIWVSRADMRDTLASIHTQLLSKQGVQNKQIRGVFAWITIPLLILGLVGAWFGARQLSGPIAALVKSADRIRDGDYTRPWRWYVTTNSATCSSHSNAMRQNLNETTITKNYLNTILNSLSDAVLVTSPDGIVKSCNEATQLSAGLF